MYGFCVCLKGVRKNRLPNQWTTGGRAHSAKDASTLLARAQPSLITTGSGFDTFGDLIDLNENDIASEETEPIPVVYFPEVPLEVVDAGDWKDVASGQWRCTDEMTCSLNGPTPPSRWLNFKVENPRGSITSVLPLMVVSEFTTIWKGQLVCWRNGLSCRTCMLWKPVLGWCERRDREIEEAQWLAKRWPDVRPVKDSEG